MLPQLIFLGAPGSGKGTQAALLVKSLGYIHVSTGDLLRAEILKGTDLGIRVSKLLSAGALVDDLTVLELLKSNCDTVSRSYIFDGFPRNVDQARLLDELLAPSKSSSMAVYFKIDLADLKNRIINRRSCPACGEIYNLMFKLPASENICSKCGHNGLVHRKDDQVSVVEKRLDIFKENIASLVFYYEQKKALFEIDASSSSDSVFESLTNIF